MSGHIDRRPNNVAAWALRPKERPLVVGLAAYSSAPKGHITIRVHDIAINPIDWIVQSSDGFGLKYPIVLGIDVAGVIDEIGDDVDGLSSSKASRGAFQKFAVVPSNAVCGLPDSIPTSVGVVLPLGITTAAAGLYQGGFLGLPFPSASPEDIDRTVLIWGGSSSVGSCAIQLATASGYRVFSTASPRNFDYCRKLGTRQVFDYHDADVIKLIVKALSGTVFAGAFHAVGGEDAVEACAQDVHAEFDAVNSSAIFKNTVGTYIWKEFLPKALKSGTIVPKPDPLIVGEELRSVQLGLDRQKAGVSASKVVITNIS
nr:zinc-binding alcohol dehydrogenase domain-containing protein cipb [Quercus suber]